MLQNSFLPKTRQQIADDYGFTYKISKILIGIFFLSILIISCKDDDNNGPGLTCVNGFEAIDGSCQCPDGMLQAYGTCRELSEDEWYGVMTGCQCDDTLFVKIRNIEDGEAQMKFNDDLIFLISQPPRPPFAGRGGVVKYFELVDGDSIAPRGLPSGILSCDVDGDIAADYQGAFYGKISPSRDKIDMLIEWRLAKTPTVVFDTCYVTFRR